MDNKKEITREDYETALNICNEYLKQEESKFQTIKKEVESLSDIDIRIFWGQVRRGDVIKAHKLRRMDPRSKLKEGDLLKVSSVDRKKIVNNTATYVEIVAALASRRYKFSARIYEDRHYSPSQFKIVNQ